jgi:hypothetical protein
MKTENYKELIAMRDTILEYLNEEKGINECALKAYEDSTINPVDSEVRIMRERERIKLLDRIFELKRHIEVIKRMYPSE